MTTKVLITGALHESALKLFNSNKLLTVQYKPDCDRDELLKLMNDVEVLVSRSETDVDRALLERASKLRVVARAAVGVGNIDIEYATKKGILVINCPGKNTNSAAELTMALLLCMLRKVPIAHQHLKSGGWDRHRFSGRELRGKTIGVVGIGNVGHRVIKFARGFDMEVMAYDPYVAPEMFTRYGAAQISSLEELAARVDILTVHVPLNRETRGMVHEKIFNLMKPGSYFVNAARGGVAVEADIVKALDSGQLAGAALDTFDAEPKPLRTLIDHEKVWVTPHIGASTEEAQIAIGTTVYEQVVKAIAGGVVDYPVNLPNVGVPDHPLLKAYAVLAEKLGALIGQMIDFNPQALEIAYRGDLAGQDPALIKLALMKGYAAQSSDDYVSFVNAAEHFAKLGVAIREIEDPDFASYKSALKVICTGPEGKKMSVGGIVFDDRHPRISLINDFYFEIDPSGYLLILENHDRPGVIGDIGVFMGKNQINIDNFTLGRNRRGGTAMAVVRLDSELIETHLQGLRQIKNVVSVKPVRL